MSRLIKFLSSLKLTVVLLALGLVLVFIGTLAQVHEGLYNAQARFFKSWFVVGATLFGVKLPWLILPGGYTIGSALFASLVTAHFTRFHWSWRRSGIFMTHLGVILLLLGQLGTDMLSTESAMRLLAGETKNYSEDFHACELALINQSLPDEDEVVAIPERFVAAKGEIKHPQLPFTVKVKEYWPNSAVEEATSGNKPPVAVVPNVTAGYGKKVWVFPLPVTQDMESRNIPSATVEVFAGTESKGIWLVTAQSSASQSFEIDGKPWGLALRFKRYYKPYSITLLDFTHDRYPGTDLPKDFRSRIRIDHPAKAERRETEIYMNNPLRYAGLTFYQLQMVDEQTAREAMARNPGEKVTPSSTFQVVKNPSWLTPYLACVMVGLGLAVQFLIHLVEFARKRAAPATTTASTTKAKSNPPRKNAEVAKK